MPAPEKPTVRPVFYDESRRRWSWVVRIGAAFLFVACLALAAFAVSILTLPLLPHNTLPRMKTARETGNPNPIVNDRRKARQQYAMRLELRRERRRLKAAIEKERRERKAKLAARPPARSTDPIVAGFYVNWEETSRSSLRKHIGEITHFFPVWLTLSRNQPGFSDLREEEDRIDVEPYVRARNLPIIPVIQNYLPNHPGAEEGHWDSQAVHDLLADPLARARFIPDLLSFVQKNRWQGINIDFEQVAAEDRNRLTQFMRELYEAFHPAGLLVTQDVQLEDDAFDIERLALWNDFVMPMFYDEHSPGDETGAGSIAGIGWTKRHVQELFQRVPADKIVMALGNYAYDWKKGDLNAAPMNYQQAVLQAKESRDPDDPSIARVQMDPKTLNPYYRYYDDDGEHVVWMMDATTAFNQWSLARPYHPRGVALWYLGAEDPTLWSVLGRSAVAKDRGRDVDAGALNTITYGRQAQVDFEGDGEMLEVVAEPSDGHRIVVRDPKIGLITAETYRDYPSGYVVRRYGYIPKKVVLTFDDGPDPRWTPQVLDILKRENVKAAFFVIGEQAELHPDILARMWEEGHEIGNHSYFHPNMSLIGPERTLLEITTTQRIIEAVTGHTTMLFRPPYAIDVEPRTGGELKPIIQASQYNFLAVGEKIDPQDWNLPRRSADGKMGADRIVEEVWNDRDAGSVILLHDGGGDRSATLAALPRIIEKLKAAGYQFITLADLRGVSRAALFPAVTGRDEWLVGIDKWVFEATYLLQTLLVTLFGLSVILGVSRQVLMAVLALIQRRREQSREMGKWGNGEMGSPTPQNPTTQRPNDPTTTVSVVIAAYNEEKVIERTVRTVLDSRYPDMQVIVVDDGSQDHTFEAVTVAFAGDPRVTCIRKPNGGKASALNRGLQDATGEIIVALDADTLFAPDTIARLARHFADPKVGAVSGNVRVGNLRNILTKWQALEYITSQNFDRRAYDLMNCITVVPGAVGAWRREAVLAVGGYTSDTLAEDTDLTWKIRRAGWRILNDSTAMAFTEAPETLRNLSRQRFRWAFGTLQNLWKHRAAMFRHGAFGWVAMPSLWLYQILFPAISPIMDATVVWALFAGNFAHVAGYYFLMIGVEFLGAALALRMDRGNWKLLPWLFLQRFVYRQLMYYVILKSLVAAVRGGAVGWNKFERRGTARLETEQAAAEDRTASPRL
jgi:cellulose synthase/poly-beta-1,6-N-acetylglucosamine synthase-like glycosyltransferase/spore germination protein YaaH/peptidoglycan/xylan/chitin deacetylase (PgdA/CDA1 family)